MGLPKVISIPKEFKPLFSDDWRECACYGGRYSMKSHTVARYLLIKARESKRRIGCFREFQNSIAESSHQLLADLIKEYDLQDFRVTDKAIVNTINGSDFIFRGLHQNEQSVKSIEGIDIGWVEEAQTVSEKSIEVLTPTIRKQGSKIIYTYNRVEEEDPIHKRLVIEGRPNTLIINVNYDIAEKYGFLPEAVRLEIEDDKAKRQDLYKHKWLGEPSKLLEERIYTDWEIIDEIPQTARLERRWTDFGYSNDPTAIGNIYVHNGAYILDEETYQKGLLNKPIADILLNLPYPRTLVIADSSEPKSIDEIKSFGVNMIGAKKQGKAKDRAGNETSYKNWGIQIVQDQKILVTRRSLNILKEYRDYLWMVDKDGIIINEARKINDHHMDGIRYAMTSLIPIIRRKEHIAGLPQQRPKDKTQIAL